MLADEPATQTEHHAAALSRGRRCLLLMCLMAICVSSGGVAALQPPSRDAGGGSDEFPEFSLPSLSEESSTGGRSAPAPEKDRSTGVPGRRPPADPFDDTRGGERLPAVDGSRADDDSVPLRPVDAEDSPEGFRSRRDSVSGQSPGNAGRSDAERDGLPGGDERLLTEGEVDWTQQQLSVADIDVGRVWRFEHGKPNLNDSELDDYVSLIRAVGTRRLQAEALADETSGGAATISFRSLWESAFYRYEDIRRQAWANGAFSLSSRSLVPDDPLSPGRSTILSTNDAVRPAAELKAYALRADMQAHPADFVGRPVVLYGLFSPSGPVEFQARETLEGEQSLYRLQRGTLRSLNGSEQVIAHVDAVSYVDPETQLRPSTAWPTDRQVLMPVLIKGWFVKLWGQSPLIYTETARVITARPYDEVIRSEVRNRRRVGQDEGWVFYETLRQLQVTDGNLQAGIALHEQQHRVTELLQELRDKALADAQALQNDLQAGRIARADSDGLEGYETRMRRLERQVSIREQRYQQHQQTPESFPILVDVFENPDRWHGRLMTVRGHVRRVLTFDGDETLFDGQPLHEVWIYPDNAQSLPMVVVTPTLPDHFPTGADVIDSVTVTGCFFKLYAYRASNGLTTRERENLPEGSPQRVLADSGQPLNRVAPMLLAGRLDWRPTTGQILSLAADGFLNPNLAMVREARRQDPGQVSDTVLLTLGFLVLFATMTIWGRAQRDRRERNRLRALVDERPDFRQTSQDLLTGPFAESRIESFRG